MITAPGFWGNDTAGPWPISEVCCPQRFDRRTLKVLHTWPGAPCEDPAGTAIDVAHKRLFTGCRNQLTAVVDYTTGKVVDLPSRPARTGRSPWPNQDSPYKYSVVQTISTQRGTRTMALDAKSHNICTVTAEFGPPPPATAERPHPWPAVISKTFTLLILAQ
jgi:hypothetical protein